MIADEGEQLAVGRELGVDAGGLIGEGELNAGAVFEVEEPEAAIGVKEQMGGAGRPDVVGHAVAGAVVALLLGGGALGEGSHFGAADHDVDFAGLGVKVDELPGVEVGEVLGVGRPGEAVGRVAGERAVAVDGVDGERRGRLLGGGGLGQSEKGKSQGQGEQDGKGARRNGQQNSR